MKLKEHCRAYETDFTQVWPRMIGQFTSDGADAFWLIAHASYLFRTSGIRWGVDLRLRTDAMMDFTQSRAAQDLSSLAFIMITHFHSDHFNLRFSLQLSGFSGLYIVPDFAPDELKSIIIASHENVRFVHEGDELTVAGHRIRVLPGHHYDDGCKTKGIASYSYRVDTPEKVLYFPGDVRDFRTCTTVDCSNADALFGHVWLGRSKALLPISETFLESYCDYLARFQAKHVYLCHLYNFSREDSEMWGEAHALAVAEGLKARQASIKVAIPRLGEAQAL